jgi:two-component system phosphate regulon sensor histidine kinase PhoR
MKKFRTRLSVICILLIGFSVLSSGILMVQMIKETHLETLRTSMLRELRIIQSTTEWPEGKTAVEKTQVLNEKARELQEINGVRVTFIDADGTVLGDSEHDPGTMDNHLSRQEISQASKGDVGYSIRYSDTVKRDMLYAAIPVYMNEDRLMGYLRIAMSLEDIDAITNRMWALLMAGLFAYFLIAGLISFRIARGLTKPLEKAIEVAKQLSNMNYKARLTVTSRDEVGQLSEAINLMADSLQLQMNRILDGESRLKNVLDNMISGVMLIDKKGEIVLLNRTAEDILGFSAQELIGRQFDETHQQGELTRLIRECMDRGEHIRDDLMFYFPEERVLEANLLPMTVNDQYAGIVIVLHDITAIRRLERMRSEFVANVSHELRTPITAIKGFAETLIAGAMNDKDTAMSFLQIIHDESNRLNRLIEDTLALSKMESKRVPMQFTPIDLEQFIGNTVEMVRHEADKRTIGLEQSIVGHLFIEADEDRLRQIMINLLSNAITYTPEGGSIKVIVQPFSTGNTTSAEDEKVRIIVKDTGIGIPKKDIPRIFERFYRVDKARSRSSGGTGLGLSIVKHLVELHHGTVKVESVVGVGTSFIIELPMIQQV